MKILVLFIDEETRGFLLITAYQETADSLSLTKYKMNEIKFLGQLVVDCRVRLIKIINKLDTKFIEILLEIDKRTMHVSVSSGFGYVNQRTENFHSKQIFVRFSGFIKQYSLYNIIWTGLHGF